jgi:hypothetical protein
VSPESRSAYSPTPPAKRLRASLIVPQGAWMVSGNRRRWISTSPVVLERPSGGNPGESYKSLRPSLGNSAHCSSAATRKAHKSVQAGGMGLAASGGLTHAIRGRGELRPLENPGKPGRRSTEAGRADISGAGPCSGRPTHVAAAAGRDRCRGQSSYSGKPSGGASHGPPQASAKG